LAQFIFVLLLINVAALQPWVQGVLGDSLDCDHN